MIRGGMIPVETQKHAVIRKLSIRRYRGFETLEWRPGPTMNLILGGGDVGKTTILNAVGLLLSASNATAVSEAVSWRRDNTAEFSIEGVVSLPGGVDPNNFSILLMPYDVAVAFAMRDDNRLGANSPAAFYR